MHLDLLNQRNRSGILKIISFLGGDVPDDAQSGEIRRAYENIRNKAGGQENVAKLLGLANKNELIAFEQALRQWTNKLGSLDTNNSSSRNAKIAALRLLAKLENISLINPILMIDVTLPEEDIDEVVGRKQIRALELVIRSLINDTYGSQDELFVRLKALFPNDFEKWRKDSDHGDLLSGTMFADLARIFLNEHEYTEYYDRIYKETPFLDFLDAKRKTIQNFLEDIRAIRNTLAHHKRVSKIDIALLDLYYEEIVDPIQKAHDNGSVRVNPDMYLDVSKDELDGYFDKLKEDLDYISDMVGHVQKDVKVVMHDTSWIKRHLKWVIAGTGGIAVVVILTFGASTKTLSNTETLKNDVRVIDQKIDTVKKETSDNPRKELANRGISWKENDFLEAIYRGDTQTVSLFLSGGMKWHTAYAFEPLVKDDAAMVQILMEHAELRQQDEYDCRSAMDKMTRIDPDSIGPTLSSKTDRAHKLSSVEKKFLKAFCSKDSDVEYARSEYKEQLKRHNEAVEAYNREKAGVKPLAQCQAELLANNAYKLTNEAMLFNPLRDNTYSARDVLLSEVYIASDNVQINAAIKKYCVGQLSNEPNIDINDWIVNSKKQILDAIT